MSSTRATVANLSGFRTHGLAALALVLVAACNPPGGDPQYGAAGNPAPVRGGTLRMATYQPVRTLDPAIAYDEMSMYITHQLFETLIGYDGADPAVPGSGLKLEPHLAESWEMSPDGKTYRFVLREGIAFSDGQPVVAADFKFALERLLRMPDSPFIPLINMLVGAKDVVAGKATACAGIVVEGERHLTLQLERPYAALPFVLAMQFASPLKADWVERVGDQIRRKPLGTGPFRLESWSEGEKLVLARNPHYYRPDRPYLDGVVMMETIPRDIAFLMFQSGELDVCDRLPAPEYIRMAESAAWKPYLHTAASMNTYGERMNVTVKPFDDKRVRQALNYALSKEHTVRLLSNGAVPSHGILPPGMLGRDESLQPYPYDPARAKRLLVEAGYPDGFDIEYVTLPDSDSEKLAQSIQADLAKVDVRVHIRLMSLATYLQAVGLRNGPSFSYAAWLMDFPDPSNFVEAKFHSRSIADVNASNDAFYSNPTLDRLMDEAIAEPDVPRRVELYHQIERILYDDAPWIWNFHRLFLEATQPYVKGYQPHPVWNRVYEDTWLDLPPDGTRPRLNAAMKADLQGNGAAKAAAP